MSFRGYENWNELADDLDDLPHSQAASRLRHKAKQKTAKSQEVARKAAPPPPPQVELTDENEEFRYTYRASRHEALWLNESLAEFFEHKWFDDLLRLVKGGKEASVYQCKGNATTGQAYLAAKVYRPRRFRSLKNDHLYREGRDDLDADGRLITNDGMLHAMHKKTGYGMELLFTSWIEHEVRTMKILRAAGADVPEPYASGNNAILMTYLGDEEMGAPSLNDVELDYSEAKPLYQRVLWNIELMLANQRIHGDLSAYNILYQDGAITLIDFPQAIDPERNQSAYVIFRRDVTRVCEYFRHYGIRSEPAKIANDLWTAYHHRLNPELDPRYLDDQNEEDRARWFRQTGR